MQVDASTTSSVISASDASSQALGKQEFLEILVAQLGNQDPLNPMDDKEFIAQLAQFSSLEQLMATNERLGLLQVAQSAMANAQMTSLIGKEVRVRTDTVTISADNPTASVNLRLDSDAAKVTIRLVDANGHTVRTLNQGATTAGSHEVVWDGRDDDGNAVPAGSYHVEVEATNADGNPVTVTTEVTGICTGVSFESGSPQLIVDGLRIAPADVIEINTPDSPSADSVVDTSDSGN